MKVFQVRIVDAKKNERAYAREKKRVISKVCLKCRDDESFFSYLGVKS